MVYCYTFLFAGSELKELFDHHIKEMREKGLLEKLIQTFLPPSMDEQEPQLTAYSLGFENLFFTFILISSGISFALILFLMEIIVSSKRM